MSTQFSPVWNNAAIDFSCIKANVTNTNSGSGSTLLDLLVDGVSKFSIDKTGKAFLASNIILNSTADTQTNIYRVDGRALFLRAAGNISGLYVDGWGQQAAFYGNTGFYCRDIAGTGWSQFSCLSLTLSGDAILQRDAANTLAQRNSTNQQRFNLYGTYDSNGTNYRRLYLDSTTAGAFTIGVEGAGTGASNNTLQLLATTINVTSIGNSSYVKAYTPTPGTYVGNSGITLELNGYFGNTYGWYVDNSGAVRLSGSSVANSIFIAGNGSAAMYGNSSEVSAGNAVVKMALNTSSGFFGEMYGDNAGIYTGTGMPLQVRNTTACTSITTGALQVSGGVGISGSIYAGGKTITSNNPVLNLTQIWNSSGTTFTGIFQNITDTQSASGSLLLDLQVGGSSKFKVSKSGVMTLAGSDAPVFTPGNGGVYIGRLDVLPGNSAWIGYSNTYLVTLPRTGVLTWSGTGETGQFGGQGDVNLQRDAANTLALRRANTAGPTTYPQAFRLYNSVDGTDAAPGSNWERAKIAWSSNVLQIGTEKLGTGSARALELQTDGTTRLTIDGSGNTTVANGTMYFENTNGFIRRTQATNTMVFSASSGSQHMFLSGAGLFLGVPSISGYDGINLVVRSIDRGGNSGDGLSVTLLAGNGSASATPTRGGHTYISGGNAVAGTNVGGNVYIDAGQGFGGGSNGKFIIGSTIYTLTCFAGTTSSFPAIKRNSAALNFRLADDSADCDITAKAATFSGNVTVSAANLVTDTTTGTKIGTATNQKLGFWNATPDVQPTTAVAAATLVANGGNTITDTDTFDGYTLKQIVKALRNIGILA